MVTKERPTFWIRVEGDQNPGHQIEDSPMRRLDPLGRLGTRSVRSDRARGRRPRSALVALVLPITVVGLMAEIPSLAVAAPADKALTSPTDRGGVTTEGGAAAMRLRGSPRDGGRPMTGSVATRGGVPVCASPSSGAESEESFIRTATGSSAVSRCPMLQTASEIRKP